VVEEDPRIVMTAEDRAITPSMSAPSTRAANPSRICPSAMAARGQSSRRSTTSRVCRRRAKVQAARAMKGGGAVTTTTSNRPRASMRRNAVMAKVTWFSSRVRARFFGVAHSHTRSTTAPSTVSRRCSAPRYPGCTRPDGWFGMPVSTTTS
jgi:hypothetical protein